MERLWKMWKTLQFARSLKSDLRATATVEPSADLWSRIQQEVNTLPVGAKPTPRFPMSRRLAPLMAACLLLLVVGVGAVGAQQGWFTWRRPYQQQIGPFIVSGYFYGWMEYYDANGTLQAVVDTHQETSRGGTYAIRSLVPGMVTVTGSGPIDTYVLKDDSGQPAATLVLRKQYEDNANNPIMTHDPKTLSEARDLIAEAWQWQVNRWRTGSVSMEETPLGVTGYHGAAGLIWSLRGTAAITVEPTAEKMMERPHGTTQAQRGETSTGFGGVLADAIAEYEREHPKPEFHAIYRDNAFHVLGFGRHELRDKNGAVLLIVTIEKLKTTE